MPGEVLVVVIVMVAGWLTWYVDFDAHTVSTKPPFTLLLEHVETADCWVCWPEKVTAATPETGRTASMHRTTRIVFKAVPIHCNEGDSIKFIGAA